MKNDGAKVEAEVLVRVNMQNEVIKTEQAWEIWVLKWIIYNVVVFKIIIIY